MLWFLLFVYLGCIACYFIFKFLLVIPKLIPAFFILALLPVAPFIYAPKAWNKQPKWLIISVLLIYIGLVLEFIFI